MSTFKSLETEQQTDQDVVLAKLKRATEQHQLLSNELQSKANALSNAKLFEEQFLNIHVYI